MAFDGSGTFLRLYSWVQDAITGTKIRADRHDDEDNNFAAGLTNCITKDGQTTVTQNIPFNSKRITALQDPVDPQDAATKAYADTKAALDGEDPFTGDVTIKNNDPSLTLDGKDGFKNSIFGDKGGKHRWEIVLGNATPETGGDVGSDFELLNYHDDGTLIAPVLFGNRKSGLVSVKTDPVDPAGIVTKAYADTKLPLTGGTVTGDVTLNGRLTTQDLTVTNPAHFLSKYIAFGGLASNAFIQWISGHTYALGGGNPNAGGGFIWHSGNLTPSTLADMEALRDRVAALEARLEAKE